MTLTTYSLHGAKTEYPETKEKLLIYTYERLSQLLDTAYESTARQMLKEKAEVLSKITNIIITLKASLDTDAGGEIAKNLSRIYDFCIRELIKANATNDPQKIKQVKEILTPIYDGFKKAAENIEKEK